MSLKGVPHLQTFNPHYTKVTTTAKLQHVIANSRI